MSSRSHLGAWTLTFLVVANMIGAGVFTTSGFTLADLGSPWLVVAAWIVGGLIALVGAVSYGRLVQAMPESGGEYLFLSRGLHPVVGFIAGWVSLIAGFTGAIAFAASAFASYALPEQSPSDRLPDIVAILVVVLSGVFHGVRPKIGVTFQNATVIAKLLMIVVFLLFAVARSGGDVWQGASNVDTSAGLRNIAFAFAGSLVWISLSYSGFNAAVYVAGEARDIRNHVPRALVAGTLTVTVIYVLLNAVFVFAPPSQTIAGRADVAAIAAVCLGGDMLATFVRGVIAVALLTSVSSMIMAAPRVYARMADDGLLPAALRFRSDAPRGAIVVQVVLAVIIILVTTLKDLLSYLGLTLSLSAACSVGCLFLPTIRRAPLIHMSSVAPAMYIAGTVLSAVLLTISEPKHLIGVAATFGSGAVVWYAITKGEWFSRPPDV